MATHFARGILTEDSWFQFVSLRLAILKPETCLLTDERVFSPPEAFLPN
ncbi:hypothetical protein SEEPBA42_03684 [Salmonella enterica subsp. enterica serovar Paratyphi B str. SARA42]|nr:hypothetical protein SEEPBA42_03684 [Salmonella enterica subsp. enterica serovar Paratyphi B str. SARA42]SUH55541.1 Uncharacterised protein [Salmonella enterica subsp. enterica serovar Braenderup]